MREFAWARWWPLTGVAFVVCWIVAFAISPGGDTEDTDAEILARLADSGDRHRQIAGFFLIVAAGVLFVWFIGSLRHRMQQSEGGAGLLTGLGFGAGLVAAALWTVAGACFTAVTFVADDSDKFQPDPNVARLFDDFGYAIWTSGTTIAAVLVAATALLSLRTDLLPKWLAWVSFVVALTMIFAITFIPFLILLGWMLVVSGTLIFRPSVQAPPAATPA